MSFRQLLATVAVAAATGLLAPLLLAVTWTSTYDGSPTGSENANQIDELIQSTRTEVRQRVDVEHDFGEQQTNGNNYDTGRHHVGSGRIFVTTDCSSITTITEPDLDGNSGLDNGRMCWDTDDNILYTITGASGDPPTGGTWQTIFNAGTSYIPSGTIVMRVDATSCGTGWTDVTSTYEDLGFRVADISADTADIPDTAGLECSSGTQDTGCSGTATEYDDTLDLAEMPSHNHDAIRTDGTAGALTLFQTSAFSGTKADTSHLDDPIEDVGGGDPHYHPFFTVRLCKKD